MCSEFQVINAKSIIDEVVSERRYSGERIRIDIDTNHSEPNRFWPLACIHLGLDGKRDTKIFEENFPKDNQRFPRLMFGLSVMNQNASHGFTPKDVANAVVRFMYDYKNG